MKTEAELAKCPLAPMARHAAPYITYYYDGKQVFHLTNPALWREVWAGWKGKRLWAIWWHLTHRTTGECREYAQEAHQHFLSVFDPPDEDLNRK